MIWLVYTSYIKPYYIVKRRTRLSGPPPKIFLGNYSALAKDGSLDTIPKWILQYGPTFICYFGIKPVIMTQEVEIIRSVMVKNFDSFVDKHYVSRLLGIVEGIPMMTGDQWRRVRRILTPTFSIKKLRMMQSLIEESCTRLRNKLVAVSDTDSSINVCRWFGIFTMEVIFATAFSRDIHLDSDKEHPLMKAATDYFKSYQLGSSLSPEKLKIFMSHFSWSEPILKYLIRITKIDQDWKFLEEAALQLIEDRRNTMTTVGSTAQDLLQLMLEAHDENAETKSNAYLNNEEIVASIVTFIVAGYETARNALSYTAYLLALNPTIQDKLIREINEYYETNPDCTLYDAAENIEYVTMVLYESMRLFPPISETTRECNQTCAVTNELIVEEGTVINIPIYVLHHNAEYWSNPNKFDPERFNPHNEKSYPTFAYLPFGEGPRQCIAKNFSLMEAKMVLVTILKEFQFKRTTDTEEPLDLCVGITMFPKNGINLSITSNC